MFTGEYDVLFILRSDDLKFDSPYFSIFGRITLDEQNAVSACVGGDPFSSCGYSREWLIPFLQGGYLLLVNILLINLLIA